MSINNGVIGDVIKESISDRCNIYENEMRSLVPISGQIQDALLSTNDPSVISSDELN